MLALIYILPLLAATATITLKILLHWPDLGTVLRREWAWEKERVVVRKILNETPAVVLAGLALRKPVAFWTRGPQLSGSLRRRD